MWNFCLLPLHSASCILHSSFPMKCLITGAGGFIGSHLTEFLLAQKQAVAAVAHRQTSFLSALKDQIEIACGDLLDDEFIANTLARHNPDIVFHLAAQSLPQTAWKEPASTLRINLIGSLKLFDAALRLPAKPIIVAASSSSVYAACKGKKPLAENSPLQPGSIYAASKLALEHLANVYSTTKGLKIICVRPFFIIGARKEGDVSSDFARQIVRIEQGKANDLPAGNLSNIRDFLDVRDGVAALWQIALKGKENIYNICSGKGLSIGELLNLFKKSSKVSVRESGDPARMHRIDGSVKIGGPARLMALGWKPEIDIGDSARDILDYWRKKDGG